MTYAVKCDECKDEIRTGATLAESAAGGTCDKCRQPAKPTRGATMPDTTTRPIFLRHAEGTIDVARNGGTASYHVVPVGTQQGDDVVALCGLAFNAKQAEVDVDARASVVKRVDVCGNCRPLLDRLIEPNTTEEDTMTAAIAPKPRAKNGKKPAAPKPAVTMVAAQQLRDAIKTTEAAISSQPARGRKGMTDAQQKKAHTLGKAIAADRWLLKRAKAGKTPKDTVDRMVARILARVQERNGLRAER